MPLVLTESSTVQCLHAGSVTVTAAAVGVLKVGGTTVLSSTLSGATIAGCGQTSPSTTPCTNVASQNPGGTSMVLKVNGAAVLLEGAAGLTSGAPGNTWSVKSAGQTLLKAA